MLFVSASLYPWYFHRHEAVSFMSCTLRSTCCEHVQGCSCYVSGRIPSITIHFKFQYSPIVVGSDATSCYRCYRQGWTLCATDKNGKRIGLFMLIKHLHPLGLVPQQYVILRSFPSSLRPGISRSRTACACQCDIALLTRKLS